MALFIQNDSGTLGGGAVSALTASVDVGLIAGADAGGIGTGGVTGRPELEQIAYPTQSATGPCQNRLFTLVNTDFGVNADNIDIIILAGGEGFALADGTLLTVVGGTSLEPGATFGGTVFNPTTSIVVLYDTTQNGGQGFCAKPQDSNDMTLQTPNVVILYHELSHAFRQATNSLLDTNEPTCTDASDEEAAAAADENDMRDQLVTAGGGTPGPGTRRDTNNHCGASCTGGSNVQIVCCIVASIATGSSYSGEVSALRGLRDSYLRASETGHDFFERLHTDYYNFSPQVCRLLAANPETSDRVATFFVRPLVLYLNLVRDRALAGWGPEELAARFLASVEQTPVLAALEEADLERAMAILQGKPGATIPESQLAELIETRARPSEAVRWALLEPLEVYTQALLWRREGLQGRELGEALQKAMGEWGARFPISEAWDRLSNRGFRAELDFLRRTLLTDDRARTLFARRLPERFWQEETKARLLTEAGFGKE